MKTVPFRNPDQSLASRHSSAPDGEYTFALEGLKTALAGIVALFAAEALHLLNPQWSLFTVMVLTIVHYPGSIAFKALLRIIGTLVGATFAVWLVSDYESAPVFFLGVTFVVVGFATYHIGRLGLTMTPYQYFLAGFTVITVESSALAQPDRAWTVALSRTEEVIVGIVAVLLVTPLFGTRSPRLEFQQIAKSTVAKLGTLMQAQLQSLMNGTDCSAALRREETALVRTLASLAFLLAAARREGAYFRADIAVLSKVQHSLQTLFQAVLDLNQPLPKPKVTQERLRGQLATAQSLLERIFERVGSGAGTELPALSAAFQALYARTRQSLRFEGVDVIPAEAAPALLRLWNALSLIQTELLNLNDLKNRLGHPAPAPNATQPVRTKKRPPIDRWGLVVAVKGAVATVAGLFLVNWLRLPGATIIPTAAWTAVIVTSFEIPLGRSGDLRSFLLLLKTAVYGFLIVLVTLLTTPFMSDYWVMNLVLFCIAFAYGYFACQTPGISYWMQCTLLLIASLVALNAQAPVPFLSVINSYLGTMIGLSIGLTISRVLWPNLPQAALKRAIVRFCGAGALVLGNAPKNSTADPHSMLATSPLAVAQSITGLGVNRLLREEQVKWNSLVPVLIRLSAQLQRLAAIRTKTAPSPALQIRLDGLHDRFRSWMDSLGTFFRRPEGAKALPSLRDDVERLRQEEQRLRATAGSRTTPADVPSEATMYLGEYALAAELLQQCGDLASTLRLTEYWGDYFL